MSRVLDVHAAAISAGLDQSRTAVLSGLDSATRSSLPVLPNPNAQLLSDLMALNAIDSLQDGSCPLVSVLNIALQLTKGRSEAVVFRAALDVIEAKVDDRDRRRLLIGDWSVERPSKAAAAPSMELILRDDGSLSARYLAPAADTAARAGQWRILAFDLLEIRILGPGRIEMISEYHLSGITADRFEARSTNGEAFVWSRRKQGSQ